MLKKSRTANDATEPMPTIPPEISPKGGEKTVIGEQISIEGDIRGKEDLIIEGSIKGRVELEGHHLTVGSKGLVEAEITADNVTISGRLVGNITALGKVAITKEADFHGEIKAKRLSIEDGAYLKAVIELEKEPVAKLAPAAKPTPANQSASNPGPLSLDGEATKSK
jgi:cytoskeletal protein CcmA (bactofilin family)